MTSTSPGAPCTDVQPSNDAAMQPTSAEALDLSSSGFIPGRYQNAEGARAGKRPAARRDGATPQGATGRLFATPALRQTAHLATPPQIRHTMRTLVFPGSFNPVTNSHVDLARRGRDLFDRVIVAVNARVRGEPTEDVEARASLCRLAFEGMDGIEVDTFDCLLSEYVRGKGSNFVLRSMRTVADFEYEFQRLDMTRSLAPEIEFVFLVPSESCAFLSSTLVREIHAFGGDVSEFVPPAVAAELDRRRDGA